MKLTIEVNKKLFKLKPHAFTILIYCTAYYEKNKQVPSMKLISKEVNIGYHTIRKAFSEIYLYLVSEAEAHRILYKRFYFLLSKTQKIHIGFNKSLNSDTDSIVLASIWNNIVLNAKEHYSDSVKSYSKYYWRVASKLRILIEKVGSENLEEYIEWYFRVKAPRISYFNPSVFCHLNIIADFKSDHNTIKARIVNDEKGYEKESQEEEKKILEKLIERKDKGMLDEYDKELLKYYKKQGWV